MIFHLGRFKLTDPSLSILYQVLPKGDCTQVPKADRATGKKGNDQAIAVLTCT